MSTRLCMLFAAAAACANAAAVQPPPLPPGSALVRVEGGLSEPERKRQIRAHHHKGHYKKDHTHDDSLDAQPPAPAPAPAPGSGNGNGNGGRARR